METLGRRRRLAVAVLLLCALGTNALGQEIVRTKPLSPAAPEAMLAVSIVRQVLQGDRPTLDEMLRRAGAPEPSNPALAVELDEILHAFRGGVFQISAIETAWEDGVAVHLSDGTGAARGGVLILLHRAPLRVRAIRRIRILPDR